MRSRACSRRRPFTTHRPRRTGKFSIFDWDFLERASPVGDVHIDGEEAEAVALGVFHERGAGVEAHRLVVQQARVELGGAVDFQPRARIRDEREANRMRLGEAIQRVGTDRSDDLLDGRLPHPTRGHRLAQLFFHALHPLLRTVVAERAPQLLGLAAGESGHDHRDFQHLLLEKRDAEGALEHGAHALVVIRDGLATSAPREIRVHEMTLDRAGAMIATSMTTS